MGFFVKVREACDRFFTVVTSVVKERQLCSLLNLAKSWASIDSEDAASLKSCPDRR